MLSLEKILLHAREVRTNFVRISYEFRTNFTLPQYSHTFIHVKFARNSYEFGANFTRFPRNSVAWGRGMVETCDKCLPHSTGFVPNTMARPKEPFHLLADRTQRRRLQELQQVVTKEFAAPYTVKYLPDTGQIVLTRETRVVVAVHHGGHLSPPWRRG